MDNHAGSASPDSKQFVSDVSCSKNTMMEGQYFGVSGSCEEMGAMNDQTQFLLTP